MVTCPQYKHLQKVLTVDEFSAYDKSMKRTQEAEAKGMADARKDARYELWNPRSTGKAYRRGYSQGHTLAATGR